MHDKNGTEIKVGDTVAVEFEVTSIHPESDYCNVYLTTMATRKVDGRGDSFVTTADLTRLVNRAPPAVTDAAPELPATLDAPPVPEAPVNRDGLDYGDPEKSPAPDVATDAPAASAVTDDETPF